jgi:hypothetical protein
VNDWNRKFSLELEALYDVGWLPCRTNAPDFEAHIAAWQGEHGLKADGLCGPATWAKLREVNAAKLNWLPKLPKGSVAIRKVFGPPGDARLVWSRIRKVRVHELIRNEFDWALDWGMRKAGHKPESVQTYNLRKKRGLGAKKDQWSTHAWGIAFDVDPPLNPYVSSRAKIPATATVVLHPALLAAFRVLGWSLGMDWRTPDLMHVQAATGY